MVVEIVVCDDVVNSVVVGSSYEEYEIRDTHVRYCRSGITKSNYTRTYV